MIVKNPGARQTISPFLQKLRSVLRAMTLMALLTLWDLQAGPREPWMSATIPSGDHLRGVTFGNGMFVAVGSNGQILSSTDGAIWTVRQASSSSSLYGITFGTNGFVAVGCSLASPTQPVACTSTDGISWVNRTVSDLGVGNVTFRAVAYGKGLFVAVGGNAATNVVATSTNGINWVPRNSHLSNTGLTPLGGVAYGNGVFVAVGADLITSTDGVVWQERDSSAWYRLYAVTYGDGRFVAVGPYSRICSSDGTNWTVGNPSVGTYINGVAYGDGTFVCVKEYVSGSSATCYSTNGTHWIEQSADTPGNAIAFGNGIFVAVGDNGKVYRTMNGMHLALTSGSAPELTLSGLVPGSCRLEVCTNLGGATVWSPLKTLVLTNSPMRWTDQSRSNNQARFYRAVWMP